MNVAIIRHYVLARLFVPSRVMHDKTKIMVKDQFVVGKEKKTCPQIA